MFDRIRSSLSQLTSQRFCAFYGSGIEDIYIDGNGSEHSIEQALMLELKERGYERVVFASPHNPLYFWIPNGSAPLLAQALRRSGSDEAL
jgi:hypothetical protein